MILEIYPLMNKSLSIETHVDIYIIFRRMIDIK